VEIPIYNPGIDQNLVRQPPVIPGQGLGTLAGHMSNGYRGIGSALFNNADPNADPAYLAQARNNAMLTLGLGLLASHKNEGFGRAALGALSNAQNDFSGAMQTAYRNRLTTNEDNRRTQQDQQQQDNWKWSKEHGLQREKVQDARQTSQDALAQREADRMARGTDAQVAASGASARAQGVNTAVDQYKLDQAKRDTARRDELLAKPNRTPAEDQELNMLAGGTPQGMLGAQYRDPNYLLNGMGGGFGQPGMPGVMPGGNPLFTDPELGIQPPPQRAGAQGSW